LRVFLFLAKTPKTAGTTKVRHFYDSAIPEKSGLRQEKIEKKQKMSAAFIGCTHFLIC